MVITNDGGSGTHGIWRTTDGSGGLGNCQVYISDWTDTSITLQVGLPTTIMNSNQSETLSPLTDMSPLPFFQQTPVSTCPVAWVDAQHLDSITLTITNPQSGQTNSSQAVLKYPVSPAGTSPY